MKIITVVGARPQFIKASALSREIRKHAGIDEVIVHTGQHYDINMSEVFFRELDIPAPHYNLEVGSESHGKQTGLMMERIEKVLLKEKPAWVIVLGDTNSTIAGALAATKLNIKVAHVEAGLRSYNRAMPEEINRIATDHIADLLFVPTRNAMNILAQEGLKKRSVLTGDIMYDTLKYYENLLNKDSGNAFYKAEKPYYLATIHRQENTDNPVRLKNIFKAFSLITGNIVLPLHPRTKKYLKTLPVSNNVNIIEPTGYLNLLHLLKNCEKVLTDSGGLQKEAFFLKKPCITLREETEWIETLEDGWNHVVGDNITLILEKIRLKVPEKQEQFFGDGHAATAIVEGLLKYST
ncbi:MAG: UDP-N-acetylglucosamine 2-epimerase (non-hydrolyzing) [Bacteroidales bacterium]|nr:UDP-N-acetylglucosamine 2-epimerase (non-hydrolyzing) [Bacteroidales bacterium]MBN2762821.1 UDP-N-acetylglucosamine 2-epimerase (non-hydrolyzing) [Bacteroidales bacterium]